MFLYNLQNQKLDKDIKELAQRLKELLAQKKGVTIQLNKHPEYKPIPLKKIDNSRFQNISMKFKCRRCKGKNTKRTGTTTQLEPKARFICFDCKYVRVVTKNKEITPFFTLSNEQMKEEIEANKKANKKQKKLFLEKYLIKKEEKRKKN